MKKETILKQSIDKAVKNGWNIFGLKEYKMVVKSFDDHRGKPDVEIKFVNGTTLYYTVNDIIFSHPFAKAFFGEGKGIIKVHYKSNKLVPKPIRDERIELINV